ncbi:hypothetical protein GCM10017559_18020 [Streptosporangium longisporum]|uniref:Uncharacterized protein n=1 Tax=Streptosporangium longisporum TaxID=46187 RepID=A0ABN3XUG9_9ACTN
MTTASATTGAAAPAWPTAQPRRRPRPDGGAGGGRQRHPRGRAGCKVQVGQVHRGKVVTVVLEETRSRVLFDGEELSQHPRTTVKEVDRLRAGGHIDYTIQA